MVVDTETQTPVNTSGLINGNYLYSVRGLDVARKDTENYNSIEDHGSYTVPPARNSAASNYNFSESVQLDTGTTASNIYIPGATELNLFIDNNGRFVALTPETASMRRIMT